MQAAEHRRLVEQIELGKHVAGDVYLHVSALAHIPEPLQALIEESRQCSKRFA